MPMRTRFMLRVAALLVPSLLAGQPKPKATPASNPQPTALERSVKAAIDQSWDAFMKRDPARFAAVVADGELSIGYGGVDSLRMSSLAQVMQSCTLRRWTTSDFKAKQIATDVAIATYRAAVDITCGGKLQPPNYYISDVMQRRNGRWVAVAHHETVAGH
jgi:hypothetical protein